MIAWMPDPGLATLDELSEVPEERIRGDTMTIHISRARTAAALIAAMTATLFFGGPAANAAPRPGIDTLARDLRAAGFTDQAVKNYTELTRRDCTHDLRSCE
jgi:hypothetical protein